MYFDSFYFSITLKIGMYNRVFWQFYFFWITKYSCFTAKYIWKYVALRMMK